MGIHIKSNSMSDFTTLNVFIFRGEKQVLKKATVDVYFRSDELFVCYFPMIIKMV